MNPKNYIKKLIFTSGDKGIRLDVLLDKVNRERAINELLDKIREYLSYRLTRESDDYWVNLLLGTIEKDTELTALVYKLTGDGGLEFVLQPLYGFSKVQEV